jgi:hypothetical protein
MAELELQRDVDTDESAVAEEQRTVEQDVAARRKMVEDMLRTRDQLLSREEALANDTHDTSTNWGWFMYKGKALLLFLDEKLANLFGLNDSKFQWYVDEKARRDREAREEEEAEAEDRFKEVTEEQSKLEGGKRC